ncbi:MAG: hypothetical protein GQ532_18975 [Methylomarinum sp.]|nr:hypothetical protein [Methylomarinum sp.]
MRQVKSIKSLCEYIWSIEEKYDLLDFDIQGVKPWQAMRVTIYYELAQELGIYSLPHTKFSYKDKIINLFSIVKNSLIYNPFFLKKSDALVFPHSRTVNIEGKYIDIYSDFLINELRDSNVNVSVLEFFYLGKHNAQKNSYKKYMDFFCLSNLIVKPFFTCRLSKKERKFLFVLENEIFSETGVKINFNQKFECFVREFRALSYQFELLFNKIKAETIYLIVSYEKSAIISVARKLGIKVVEIQHGTFSQYHLGYSFPARSKPLDYFPDEFYVWDDFWKNLIKLPIPSNNIKNYGFKYLEYEKNKYTDFKKQKNRIIVLSQGVLGDQLANTLLENFSVFKDMDVYYKLHPGEYARWHQYRVLIELSKLSNFTVLTECNLYEEFSKSEFMAGVFSTAIYEGDMFGCKPMLFDLPGIEYMDTYIKSHSLERYGSIFINPEDLKLESDETCSVI